MSALLRSLGIAFLITFAFVRCATEIPLKKVSTEEQTKIDDSLGQGLAQNFEPKLTIKNDIEVSVYLRRVAKKLTESAVALQRSPVGVITIKDRDRLWRSYALPGNRVYLSIGELKDLQFENEVAAAIALQLGHIVSRHAVKRVEVHQTPADAETSVLGPDYFGPAGIFAFSKKDYLEASEAAVKILYGAGYDPRGLIAVWTKFQDNPKKSPYEKDSIPEILDRTRKAITELSPLRNPVIMTKEFTKIKKRIDRL